MNSTLVLVISLIIFAVAIFSFTLLVMQPREDGNVRQTIRAWIATDQDGGVFLYTSRPDRMVNPFTSFGYWGVEARDGIQPMVDMGDMKDCIDMPSWEDEPVEVTARTHSVMYEIFRAIQDVERLG